MSRMSIKSKVARYDELRNQREQIDKEMKDIATSLLADVEAKGEKTMTVDVDGHMFKVTRVQNAPVVIDEASLKRTLGEKKWLKVSVRVLDEKKLEAAIADGEVDPLVVAECSHEKLGKPYVKVTG